MLIDHCLYKQTTIVFATNHGQILGSSKENFEFFLSKWYRRRMTPLTRLDITVSQPLPNSWPTNLFRGNMYQWSHLCWSPVGKMLVLQGSARPYGSIQKAFLSVFNSAHPGANQVKFYGEELIIVLKLNRFSACFSLFVSSKLVTHQSLIGPRLINSWLKVSQKSLYGSRSSLLPPKFM